MKKTLSTVLIANLVFLYPSLECSQAFAGMNAEGKSFDLNAVPAAKFSLQTPLNLDLPNEIPGIAASLDNANDIMKEIKLATPNLSPERNFIGREFSPIGKNSEKNIIPIQSPINAAIPIQNPSGIPPFQEAKNFMTHEIKAWEAPKALTEAGLSQNFDNNANKDSSLSPALVSGENNPDGPFPTKVDPKTFPAPFNNSEMLVFLQRRAIKVTTTKYPYQYNSPVSNVESYPSANITPKNRVGVNWTVYDINGELWLKTAPVTPNNQALWYDLGSKPMAFPRAAFSAPAFVNKNLLDESAPSTTSSDPDKTLDYYIGGFWGGKFEQEIRAECALYNVRVEIDRFGFFQKTRFIIKLWGKSDNIAKVEKSLDAFILN